MPEQNEIDRQIALLEAEYHKGNYSAAEIRDRLVRYFIDVMGLTGPQATRQADEMMTSWGPISMGQTEKASDPFTAYRQAIGIGGKVNLNPAEQYQEGLFNPLMNLFNTNQRLFDPTSPLGKAGNVGKMYGTFSDFYGATPAGEPGISATAGRMLSNIFGASPEQKGAKGLGYEPGQVNKLTGEAGAVAGGVGRGRGAAASITRARRW